MYWWIQKKKYCLTCELVNIILMINYYLMLFRSFFINQIKNGTNKHLFGTCKMISSFNSKIEKIYCFPLEIWHLESMYALDPSQIINQHLFRLEESVIYNTNLLLNVYIRWHNHNFSLNSYILTDNPIQKREKYI